MIKIEQRLKLAYTNLDDIELRRMKLESKVKMLTLDSLDIDLLDEQSRRLLGTSLSNEIIILHTDD